MNHRKDKSMSTQQVEETSISHWRSGKPQEDPDKTKKWGWIQAKPSEFLICMRGGHVTKKGQGLALFKWPWDAVAIVPTTIQRLVFTADQVTQERVGVKVTGIAVFRIADPLIASTMLNFSYPQAAQQKLAGMLEEMCIGASRRLIANLTVEECLTRRKDALSVELIREIAPVVSGNGMVQDTTDRGWGIVVDTIEIQDVKVLSSEVFSNMQAAFRQAQHQMARQSELQTEASVQLEATETQQRIEVSKVTANTQLAKQRQLADEQAQMEKLASSARIESQRVQQEQLAMAAAAELSLAKHKFEQQVRSAQYEAHLKALADEESMLRAQAKVAQMKLELLEIDVKAGELESTRAQTGGRYDMEKLQHLRNLENQISPEMIQLKLAEKMPELAKSLGERMGEVNITSVDGGNPFGYAAAALQSFLSVMKTNSKE
jgi:flotillin